MAPPRRILREQLEILIDYLEGNKDMSKGLLPGSTVSHQKTQQKWTVLTKKLNAVQSGALKTPKGWKKVCDLKLQLNEGTKENLGNLTYLYLL